MLNFRKIAFRSFALGMLILMSVTLVQNLSSTDQSQSRSSGAFTSFTDSAIARADSAVSSFSASVPDRLKAFPHQAGLFFERNATTARLQFEGMKNSVTSRLAVSAWFGRSSPNWIQSGAQVATQAGGNKARALARKVPVVTTAMDATRDRVNSAAQSVTNTSLGF